jgi:hypothetical protein
LKLKDKFGFTQEKQTAKTWDILKKKIKKYLNHWKWSFLKSIKHNKVWLQHSTMRRS